MEALIKAENAHKVYECVEVDNKRGKISLLPVFLDKGGK